MLGTPKVHTIDFYDAKFADDFNNASDRHFTGLHRPQSGLVKGVNNELL